MKNTTTFSISLPNEVAKELDEVKNYLQVDRSTLITAIIKLALKWYKTKDLLKI